VPEVKVLQLDEVAGQLKPLSQEMRYATCVEAGRFTQGIPGTGRLRAGDREMVLKQGSICHVPAGSPHDFQATGDRELVLLYTLVESPPPPQSPE